MINNFSWYNFMNFGSRNLKRVGGFPFHRIVVLRNSRREQKGNLKGESPVGIMEIPIGIW
jgi:hypothetical protein